VTEPEPPKHEFPQHPTSGRQFLKGCLIVGLGILLFIATLIAFFTYLAHHNPRPAWS
jgi:hypothetical protein